MATVAERLGVSYNAVKIRRQRAEQRLLEFLDVLADPSGRSKGIHLCMRTTRVRIGSSAGSN